MKMVIIGFGSLLIFGFLFFVILTVTSPEKKNVGNIKNISAIKKSNYVKNLQNKYKELKKELSKTKKEFDLKGTKMDSLYKVITSLEKQLSDNKNQIVNLNEQLTKAKNEELNAREISKTFASMKTDEMRPILKNIDDKTVKMIYKNINSRMKKNFLLALTPQRAAEITKQLTAAN